MPWLKKKEGTRRSKLVGLAISVLPLCAITRSRLSLAPIAVPVIIVTHVAACTTVYTLARVLNRRNRLTREIKSNMCLTRDVFAKGTAHGIHDIHDSYCIALHTQM